MTDLLDPDARHGASLEAIIAAALQEAHLIQIYQYEMPGASIEHLDALIDVLTAARTEVPRLLRRVEAMEKALEAIIDGSPMKEPQNLWLRKLTPDEAEDLGHDKARWEMAQIARAALADARANARVMPAHDPETGELPEEEPAERRPAPREEPRQRAAGQVPPPRTARPQAGLAFGEEE